MILSDTCDLENTLTSGVTRWPLPPAGYALHQQRWLTTNASHCLFQHLQSEIEWQQPEISLFGRSVAIPRLQAWIGDSGADYRYSGTRFQPSAWTSDLDALRSRLSQELNRPFNSVLVNLYRDGQDCMHWHADDEPELGDAPCIASVSLGAIRDFRFRHRAGQQKSLTLPLGDGDLLVMGGDCQRHWQHCLPRRKRVTSARINLTFRYIST